MLDQKQTREICPCVADDVIGSCFCKTDGHANPLTTTLGFYKRGRRLGVCHITGETVSRGTDSQRKSGWSADGTIYSGDKIIITAGYESKHILSSVGIDIPMRHKLSECMVIEMRPKMPQMMFTLPQGTHMGMWTSDKTRFLCVWRKWICRPFSKTGWFGGKSAYDDS